MNSKKKVVLLLATKPFYGFGCIETMKHKYCSLLNILLLNPSMASAVLKQENIKTMLLLFFLLNPSMASAVLKPPYVNIICVRDSTLLNPSMASAVLKLDNTITINNDSIFY